jgi:hypothetical protein
MIVLTTTLVDVKTGKKNVLEKTLIKYAGQAPVDFHEKAHPVYNKLDRRDDSVFAGYAPRPGVRKHDAQCYCPFRTKRGNGR